MLDNLIGLLLLGLGVNKTFYTPNQNVKGDETVASQDASVEEDIQENEEEDESSDIRPTVKGFKPPLPPKNSFRLNPQQYTETEKDDIRERTASRAGVKKRIFNARAFGTGILRMQENFAEVIEASREAAKQERELQREEFKQQLELIKNTKKKAVVEKLNTNCQAINEKRTEKMTAMLEKLSTILTNVSNRADVASAAGKDVSSVETAITTASDAIADAQEAVAAQAGETCEITISSEANLKTDVGKVISSLQQDLKAVYEQVIAAKKAVGNAIKALALVNGESL